MMERLGSVTGSSFFWSETRVRQRGGEAEARVCPSWIFIIASTPVLEFGFTWNRDSRGFLYVLFRHVLGSDWPDVHGYGHRPRNCKYTGRHPGRGHRCNEPSVVAIEKATHRVLAVGHEAKNMINHTPEAFSAEHPLHDGVVADYDVTEP